MDDLSPRGAALYTALVKSRPKGPLSRRDAAGLLGWSYGTTRRALDELLGHELLKLAAHETPRRYQLLDGIDLGKSARLTSPDALE